MFLVTFSLTVLSASPVPLAESRPEGLQEAPQPAAVHGTQWRAASANFVVRSHHSAHDARQIAEFCEQWRSKLQCYWCAGECGPWGAKCEVVIHSGGRSYLAAVGTGASQTFGSSLVQFGQGKQVARRAIDIRGDSPHGLAAVPHELTHLVVADLLGGRQPPRWADEGMAILADAEGKQRLHEGDLCRGLADRRAFRVAELLTLETYPHASRVPAFYGQSASLTACLARRESPARFIEFLRRSLDAGYDQALREIYGIDNIAQLERLWHEQRLAWQGGYYGLQVQLN